MTYMSKWVFNGSPLTEPPQDMWGFVYKVSWTEGFYIGQKAMWSITNPKISKKRSLELYKGRGKRPTREQKRKESDWRKYNTSSKYIQSLVGEKGEQFFRWEILEFATSKSDLNYKETQQIICTDALKHPLCYNEWVSIKIRKNNI